MPLQCYNDSIWHLHVKCTTNKSQQELCISITQRVLTSSQVGDIAHMWIYLHLIWAGTEVELVAQILATISPHIAIHYKKEICVSSWYAAILAIDIETLRLIITFKKAHKNYPHHSLFLGCATLTLSSALSFYPCALLDATLT